MKIDRYFSSTRKLVTLAVMMAASTGVFCQESKLAESPNKGAATSKEAPQPAIDESNQSFAIGPEDVLVVSVWKEPEISRTVTVRADGKISLALLGDVQASGKTPQQLQTEITSKLSAYMANPTVTVIMQEIKSRRISVLGKVSHPGSYLLTNSTSVLEAIAMAGGLRDFAKQGSIYVLRYQSDGSQVRLPFNYKDVLKGDSHGQNIQLQPRDTVVVP